MAAIARLIAVVLLVSACGPSTQLPIHRPMDGGPAALLEGTLSQDGQCLLVIAEDGVQRLPLWPTGVRLEGRTLVTDQGPVANLGDVIGLGGGEYTEQERSFIESLLETPIPPGCATGRYWLVVEIIPADRLDEFR